MKKIQNKKQMIKLDEAQLEKLVKKSMERLLKESHDLSYLSDKDIHHQYEDFKIDEFTIKPKEWYNGNYGWNVGFEIYFPNVNHPDFDESNWENVIVYDETGKEMGFDHWYPDDISEKLQTMIRNEIKKHWRELQALKNGVRMQENVIRIDRADLNRMVSEAVCKAIGNRRTMNEWFQFDTSSVDSNNGPLSWDDVFDAGFMANFTDTIVNKFGNGSNDGEIVNMVDRAMELLLNNLNRKFRQ
jgi:hypothetical protein